MTGDPQTDTSALVSLLGLGLFVAILVWPAAPAASAGTAAGPVGPTVALDAAVPLLAEGGLQLESRAWRFEGAQGTAWIARVALPGGAQVRPSAEVRPFDELLPGDAGPWAAINGGFYEHGPMGLVVSDGQEHSPLSPRGGSGIFQWGPAAPAILHRSAWTPGPPQALQSIDRLVDAGRSLVKARDQARAAARSAVVLTGTELLLVALADGEGIETLPDGVQLHRTVARGLPLWAFAELLVQGLDAQTALNLDGAISTQMAVQAQGRRFHLRGEAGTINVLVIRPTTVQR